MQKTIFVRKPIDLDAVKTGIAEQKRLFNTDGCDYYIAEEQQLSNQEWQEFTSDFLTDHAWVAAFSAKDYPVVEEEIPCIRVTCPGSEITLIVDPQGYNYARYVGIESADSFEIEEEDCKEEEIVTEEEVVDGLRALLMGESLDCTLLGNANTATYEEGGYLTYDKGFTIRTVDGSVFQITVKQER